MVAGRIHRAGSVLRALVLCSLFIVDNQLVRAWLPWLAIAGLGASLRCSAPDFVCSDDAQCEGAGPSPRCEPDGACSIADDACEGGRRYASAAGALSGQCVGAGASSGGSPPGTAGDSAGTSLDDSSGEGSGDPQTTAATMPLPDVGRPPSIEVCNGEDDDGDGLVDEVSPRNPECEDCELAQYEDHAYWICREPRTWDQALEDCAVRGAELARIDSSQENLFITQLAAGDALWLGANDREVEGDWRWIDGSSLPVDHPGWGPDQPDDDGPLPDGEDCLHLSPADLFGDGDWNDDICDEQPYGALCKAPHVPSP